MATSPAPLALLRSVRSDVVRDLARRAADQGWDLYPNGGGHLSAVNPRNGALVILSTTSNGTGHAADNTRAAFRRAGLDLRPRVEVRRAHRQEARTMHVHAVTEAEVPPPTIHQAHPFVDSGELREDSRGRRRRTCATCGLVANAPQHRAAAQGEDAPVVVEVHANGTTTVQEPEEAAHQAYPLAAALDALDAALAPGLEALVAAGRQDAAELVRAELVRTPLEEELLALYRRVMTGA